MRRVLLAALLMVGCADPVEGPSTHTAHCEEVGRIFGLSIEARRPIPSAIRMEMGRCIIPMSRHAEPRHNQKSPHEQYVIEWLDAYQM